jgi:hypothetical protein
MIIWLCVVVLIMVEIGVFSNSSFIAFGPRKELTFMHVSVDTPYKYSILVVLIVAHTMISDFISDSLNPHILNALQNATIRYIPHKAYMYYVVTTIYSFYCGISQIFIIFIAFAQLDLLMVRLASDIAANLLTTTLYLQDKTYDPQKFNQLDAEDDSELATFANSWCRQDVAIAARRQTSLIQDGRTLQCHIGGIRRATHHKPTRRTFFNDEYNLAILFLHRIDNVSNCFARCLFFTFASHETLLQCHKYLTLSP